LQELDEIEASVWSELERCVATRPRSESGEDAHDGNTEGLLHDQADELKSACPESGTHTQLARAL